MFDNLSSKITSVLNKLTSKGRITEQDIDSTLREVRLALLEADVNFKVARDLMNNIREKSLNADLLNNITPGQQIIKITHEEFTNILGKTNHKILFSEQSPSVILLVGLNGSGKTTTAAKLAWNLKQDNKSPLLVAGDIYRPAAIDQLKVLGKQINVPVFSLENYKSVLDIVSASIEYTKTSQFDCVIFDTAGRFQIDEELMMELDNIKKELSPVETLLIVDSMTGQDAVNVAKSFNEKIGITGTILSKLDGDARGGAALSISSITNVPVKFIGTGEKFSDLEVFHPERLASRILGMGDVLTLIEKSQNVIDTNDLVDLKNKIKKSQFDLDDFLKQMQQIKKMGSFSQMLDMVPGISKFKGNIDSNTLDDNHFKKTEAIIYSMTKEERQKPEIISGSRRRRISLGSGTNPQDVNQLLNQFKQAQNLIKQLASGKMPKNMMNKFK